MNRDTVIALAREAELWEICEGFSNEYGSGEAEEDCLPTLIRFDPSTHALGASSPPTPTQPQLYRSHNLEEGIGKTFPVFTAIITVDKGVVTVRGCVAGPVLAAGDVCLSADV